MEEILENIPEKLKESIEKAYASENIPDDEIQTSFETDDDFYQEALRDVDIVVEDMEEE